MASQQTSKVVFKKLAEIKKKDDIDLYIQFLQNAIDLRVSLNTLAGGIQHNEDWVKKIYGNETNHPKFFDYTKYADWSRLDNSLMEKNECLCFYQEKAPDKSSSNRYNKIYDGSIIKSLYKSEKNIILEKHIFILKKNSKNELHIIYTNNYESPYINPAMSEQGLMGGQLFYDNKNIAEIINDICGGHGHIKEKIDTQLDFDSITSDPSLLKFVDKPVLLCSHVGSRINWKYKSNKIHNFFVPHGYYNEENKNPPIIICITIGQNENIYTAYTPDALTNKLILKQCLKSEGRITDLNEYMKEVAAKATKTCTNEKKQDIFTEWNKNYPCECDCCELGKNLFANNVDVNGPQQKMSINLDTREYLLFFNLNQPQIIKNLQEVYNLSVGSLDIESYTKHIGPDLKFSHISYIGRRNEIVATQEIALIGYGDSLHDNSIEHHQKFRVDESNNAQTVVSDMMEHIFERVKIIQDKKRKLLAPVYDFIKKYETVHNQFWNEELKNKKYKHEDIVKTINQSFENGLIGKFKKHIDKLTQAFYIYTFNGGNYDYNLLHRFIVAHMKQTRKMWKPLNIIKKDSRFVKMTIPNTGIHFVDVIDLTGPGSSLSSFASMTGQTETKMIFPFSQFKNADFLKRKKLPTQKKSWYNDLKQEFYTDDEIKKARHDFKNSKAKNIGEYLEHYLTSK